MEKFTKMEDKPIVPEDEELFNNNLRIYPNPSIGKIYFENSGKENLVIEVYDSQGKIIQKTGQNNFKFN